MRTVKRRVLLFESIGFGLILGLLWLNEVFDLPQVLLGAPATALNWRESALESVFVLILAAGTLGWTSAALNRIRYLEGFLRVCMFCRKINVNDEWIPIVDYVTQHSEAVFSHGLCPECERRYRAELGESDEDA
jgi:hypothetical protein